MLVVATFSINLMLRRGEVRQGFILLMLILWQINSYQFSVISCENGNQ